MSANQSVLMVAFHFPPEPLPGAARPSRFHRYLPEFGYDTDVITAVRQPACDPRIHFVPAPTLYPNKYSIRGAIEIMLHKTILPTEMGLLWSIPASRVGARILRERKIRAVITTAPPLNTHLCGFWLKRRFGIPWIADFRDPLVGNSYRLHGAVPEAADRRIEAAIFRHASLVTGVTDAMVEGWKQRYPQHQEKIRLLWNGFDPAENVTVSRGEQRTEKTLAHVGSLYGLRHPMAVLSSVERLIRAGRLGPGRLRIQLVGGIGADVVKIDPGTIQFLREHNSLESIDRTSRAGALQYMADADYLLLIDLQGRDNPYAVPAKLYEYIQTGRPILALTQRNTPVHRILSKCGLPNICIHPEDTEPEIDEKMLKLMQIDSAPSRPSDWFFENFDGRRQAETMAHLIESIT